MGLIAERVMEELAKQSQPIRTTSTTKGTGTLTAPQSGGFNPIDLLLMLAYLNPKTTGAQPQTTNLTRNPYWQLNPYNPLTPQSLGEMFTLVR